MSGWFAKGIRAVGAGQVNLDSVGNPPGDDFVLLWVKDAYVLDRTNHAVITDLGANIIARTAAFKTTLADGGIIDFTDPAVVVPGGSTAAYAILAQNTGSGVSGDSTRRLLIVKDAYTVAQLPKVTSGGTWTFSPDNTSWKFALL